MTKAKQGLDDVGRGIQGKETGSKDEFQVTFQTPSLGLTLSDHGGEGLVSAIVPGGEAERLGLVVNDRVVAVGDGPCGSYKKAVDAIRAHAARPMTLKIERRVKRESFGVGPGVNFRLDEEIDKADRILRLMLSSPMSGPPPSILRAARGLAFLRITKLGFALSARVGTGLVIARANGAWSAPSAIGTVGVSMGFQVGAQVADFLIVLNTDAAIAAFSGGGQIALSGQIGAVAGPVGASREAGVAAQLHAAAPIFTYSISKGLFVGVSLEGSVINERNSVNERHCGQPGIRSPALLSGMVPPTPAATKLLNALAAIDGVQQHHHHPPGVGGGPSSSGGVPPPAYHDSNPFVS